MCKLAGLFSLFIVWLSVDIFVPIGFFLYIVFVDVWPIQQSMYLSDVGIRKWNAVPGIFCDISS